MRGLVITKGPTFGPDSPISDDVPDEDELNEVLWTPVLEILEVPSTICENNALNQLSRSKEEEKLNKKQMHRPILYCTIQCRCN